jgi:hypothetical protein
MLDLNARMMGQCRIRRLLPTGSIEGAFGA